MQPYSQRFIRSIIRQVWNQAPSGGDTFKKALEAGCTGYWEKNETGWQVQASTGAGYSTSFHIATSGMDPNQLTPTVLQEIFELILDKYKIVFVDFNIPEDLNADFMSSNFCHKLCHYHFPTIKGFTPNFTYALP